MPAEPAGTWRATGVTVDADRLELADDEMVLLRATRGQANVQLRVRPRVDGPLAEIELLRCTVLPGQLAIDVANHRPSIPWPYRVIIELDDLDDEALAATVAALQRILPPGLVSDGPTAALPPPSGVEATLLADVLANPGGDEPRRVLSDYWLERGDPPGELIGETLDVAFGPVTEKNTGGRMM